MEIPAGALLTFAGVVIFIYGILAKRGLNQEHEKFTRDFFRGASYNPLVLIVLVPVYALMSFIPAIVFLYTWGIALLGFALSVVGMLIIVF